ncbi:MAG: hypothetical protein QCH31_02210 [Methanolobus sp.]|nr:hypothetical protein [Methanolobus sp.]
MSRKHPSVLIILIIAISMAGSGCVSHPPEETVNDVIIEFLTAINEDDFNSAFDMYKGRDFLAPASIRMSFNNKGIEPGNIDNIDVRSLEVSDNVAIATVDCSISSRNQPGMINVIPIYFRVQDSEIGWIITRVSFNSPLTLEGADNLEIELASTPVDFIVDNASVISVFAFFMLGGGIYLDRKDKAKKKESKRTINVSGAVPVHKEIMVQYVRFVPPEYFQVGKAAKVDVWVKNFTQHPYNNFAIKAKFANSLEVRKINLFFGDIAPGETAKRTWIVIPKMKGWISIEEPTVVFEYMGTKYIGVLDPVWLQVQ